MRFVHHSFLTHRICPVLRISQKLRNRTVLHAANVWRPVRQVLSNWDRNYVIKKAVRLHIHVSRFRVISHGANICGHTTTAIWTASTAMTPVLHRAKQPVRHISAYRDICSSQKKAAMRMHLRWSKKTTHFRLSADMYVIDAVKMPAQEARLTKR